MDELIEILSAVVPLVIWFVVIRGILSTFKKPARDTGRTAKANTPPPKRTAAGQKRAAVKHETHRAQPKHDPEPLQTQMTFEGIDPCHDHMDERSPYEGSLKAQTSEGEDPGHDHSLHQAASAETQTQSELIGGSVLPDFTDRGELARAFVLQEILTRPSDRRRR